jgi:LacI family transcriptional regulator
VITLKEIARQAEVSVGTVDRVLHDRGRVSKASIEKVKAIITKTRYRTNIHAQNLSLQATHHFGVIMPYPHQDGYYWEMMRKGVDQAVEELASFNVHRHFFYFDKFSEASFVKAGTQALDHRVEGLIIAPVLFDACHAFVRSIPDEVPYIYVDSTIPGTAPMASIGQNSFQSGLCGAKLMRMLLTKEANGDIAVLRMLPNDFHINERVRGFLSFFDNVSGDKVYVFDVDTGMGEREFVQRIGSIDDEVPDCKGFFVTNAQTHRVVKALLVRESAVKHIIGYDCIEENLRLLETGNIDFIISQKTREQGYSGITALFRNLVLKERCAGDVRMPIDIVSAGNASFYR